MAHIANNEALIEKLYAVVGRNDSKRSGEIIEEIIAYGRKIDPTLTLSEGLDLVVMLLKMRNNNGDDNE